MRHNLTKRATMLICLVALLVCSANAQYRGKADFKEGGVWYHIEDNQSVSVDFDGIVTLNGVSHLRYEGDVVIPETVEHNGNTYTVVGINPLTFYFCPISSVTLPNTIKSIGMQAFAGSYIEELTLPSSLETFGSAAFGGCHIKSITIPSGVKELPDYLFKQSQLNEINLPSTLEKIGIEVFYQTQITNINIPEGVEEIPERAFMETPLQGIFLPTTLKRIANNAFQNSSQLTNLMLHEGLEYIGESAFSNCARLSQITIPNTVLDIGDMAFLGCTDLKYVNIQTPHIKKIGRRTFFNCSSLDQMSVIPDSVRTIGEEAFCGCNSLLIVFNPQSQLRSIARSAFAKSGIYDIAIPHSVDSIAEYAFSECDNLVRVVMPKSLTSIKQYTFKDCTALKKVVFPKVSSLKEVEGYAFSGCASIDSLAFPEGLETIRRGAYTTNYNQSSQLKYVNIPSTVRSIEGNAFEKGAGERDIVFDFVSPIDSVGYMVFNNADRINIRHYENWIRIVNNSTFSSKNYPGYFPHVYQNDTLVTTYVIPDDITTIKVHAFYYNTDIQSVVFPKGLHTIESGAFMGCSALQQVTLGDSIKFVGGSAFKNCKIQKVHIASMDSWVRLVNCSNGGDFQWNWFSAVYMNGQQVVDYVIPNDITDLKSYAFQKRKDIRSVVFSEKCRTIGSYAFDGCSELQSVAFSDSLKNIATYAFNDCKALKTVSFGKSEAQVDFYAFRLCAIDTTYIADSDCWIRTILNCPRFPLSSFPNVYYNGSLFTGFSFPEGVTSIRDNAFSGNKNIQSVTFPHSLKTIGNNAFNGCSNLKSVTFGDSIELIGSGAFSNCSVETTNISNYDGWVRLVLNCATFKWAWFPNVYCEGQLVVDYIIPEGITSIRDGAFLYHPNMESVTFPNSLKEIGTEAFRDCPALKTIVFGDSIKTIKTNAFWGCSLTKVDIGDIANWCGISFEGTPNYQYPHLLSNPLTVIGQTSPLIVKGKEVNSLKIPTGVTRISRFAFYGLKHIEDVTFPNSVTEIGEYAFCGCTDLTTIKYGKNPKLTTIGNYTFANSAIYNVGLPNSVTNLGDGVFSNCQGLATASIPGNIENIPNMAFADCRNLVSITLAEGVKSIGDQALAGCGFQSIEMPTTLETIGGNAFLGTYLSDIHIKDLAAWCSINCLWTPYNQYCGVKHFYLNGQLLEGELVIPDGVTDIGNYIFYYNSDFTSIVIPEGVKTIGAGAFCGLSKIQSISLPSSIESIGRYAFGWHGDRAEDNLLWGQDITLNVTNIGAFVDANKSDGFFFDHIYGSYAIHLYLNGDLVSDVLIPNGITSIGERTFSHFNITSAILPSTLESILGTAFQYCDNLKYVYARSRFAPTGTDGLMIGNNWADNRNLQAIYVPKGRSSNYKTKWNNSANFIVEAPEEVCFFGPLSATSLSDSVNAHNYVYDTALPYLDLTGATLDETVTAESLQDIADKGTIVFLPEGTEGIEGTNIVANGRTPKLILRDSTNFAAPYDFTADELEYQRYFPASRTEATTICLPYDMNELPQGMKVYQLTGQDTNDNAVFEEVDVIEANKPYVVTTTKNVDGLVGENVLVKATPTEMPDAGNEAFEFRGTLSTISHDDAADEEAYVLTEGKQWLSAYDANEDVYVPAGRAYLVPADAAFVSFGTVLNTTSHEDYVMGDVNGDDKVDLSDAIMVTYYSLHVVLSNFNTAAADMNGDGKVDLSDAIVIIYKSLGVK